MANQTKVRLEELKAKENLSKEEKRELEKLSDELKRQEQRNRDTIASAGSSIVSTVVGTAAGMLFRWLLAGNGGDWYTHRQAGDSLGETAKGWGPNVENFIGYYKNSRLLEPANNPGWTTATVSPVQVERFTRGLTTYTDSADTSNGFVTLINELFDALQATNGSSRNPRYCTRDVGRFVYHARVGATLLAYYASQLRAVRLEKTNDTTLPRRLRTALNCDTDAWNIRNINWPARVATLLEFAQSLNEIFNIPTGFIKRDRWIQTGWFCDENGSTATVRVCLPDEMWIWEQNNTFTSLGALARSVRTPQQMEELLETFITVMRMRKEQMDTMATDLKSLYGARNTYSEIVEDFTLGAGAQCAAPFVVDPSFNHQYHNAKFLAARVVADGDGGVNVAMAYPVISVVGDYGMRIQMGIGGAPKNQAEIAANVAGLLYPSITNVGQYVDISKNADFGTKLKASLWAYTWDADVSSPNYPSAVLSSFAIDYLVARQPMATMQYKYSSATSTVEQQVTYPWMGTYILLYNVRSLAAYTDVILSLIPTAEMEHAPELTLFDVSDSDKDALPYTMWRCANRVVVENYALKDAQRQCVKSYYHIPTLIKRSKAEPNVQRNGR